MNTELKRKRLEDMSSSEIRKEVKSYLKALYEKNSRRSWPVRVLARGIGARYRNKKDSSRVSYALRKLIETDPDIDEVGCSANERRYRYLPFEERKKLSDEKAERDSKRSLGKMLAKFAKLNGCSEPRVDYRGRITMDSDDLLRLLRSLDVKLPSILKD